MQIIYLRRIYCEYIIIWSECPLHLMFLILVQTDDHHIVLRVGREFSKQSIIMSSFPKINYVITGVVPLSPSHCAVNCIPSASLLEY